MNDVRRGIVVFADVLRSRAEPAAAIAWLRFLSAELDRQYGVERLAPFGFTQGDELQGLVRVAADPLVAVLRAGLNPASRPMRWVAVAGAVEPGTGPATERAGPAFIKARELIEAARHDKVGLLMQTGDASADELLAGLAPTLAYLIGELTPRQRTIGWHLLIQGRRQSEVARLLAVSRPTVSIAVRRSSIRPIEQTTRVIRSIFQAGVEAAILADVAPGPAAGQTPL